MGDTRQTINYGDILDSFGSGGANVPPNQGVPSLRDAIASTLARHHSAVANTTALQATLAKNRVDGQLVVKLDDYSVWAWEAASAAGADSTHVAPTDVGVGAGRWVKQLAASGADQGEVQHVTIDIPLTTIQAQTSGVPFNVGAALPANARLLAIEENTIQVLGGGSISAGTLKVQNTAETAGAVLGGGSGLDIHGAGTGRNAATGSNPYATRGGQQLQATIASVGDTLAHATTGHVALDLYYAVDP
jgi:hypothetical protein